jgi:hypothetical protein
MTHLTSSFALFSGALCHSSQQIPGLDKLKLLNRPGSELMAVLAEVALLHAFFAAVILARLHYPITAAVRAPAVLSSHRSTLILYMQQNIIGIYLFVKRRA